jgi:hypothetical protein
MRAAGDRPGWRSDDRPIYPLCGLSLVVPASYHGFGRPNPDETDVIMIKSRDM